MKYTFVLIVISIFMSCQSSNKSNVIQKQYCFAKKVFKENNLNFIEIDSVSYLTGLDATNTAIKEGDYYVDEDTGDTLTYVLDGYYVSNINKESKIFKVAEDVKIDLFYSDKNTNFSIIEVKGTTIDTLKLQLSNDPLLIISLDNDVVKEIKEVWLP